MSTDDSTRYPEYPVPGLLPRVENISPADVEEAAFGQFLKWFTTTEYDQLLEVLWNSAAGETSPALIAVLRLYCQPEKAFEEPYLFTMPGKHGEAQWLNDFDIYTGVLESDMENWFRSQRVTNQINDELGWSGDSAAGEGYVMRIAERGIGRLVTERAAGNEREDVWFRLDWPRLIDWWRDSLRELGQCFEPDGYVYLLQAGPFYKIGRAKDVSNRLTTLKIQLPFPVELVHSFPAEEYIKAEAELHRIFANERKNGEWFVLEDWQAEWIREVRRMRGVTAEDWELGE